MMVPETWSWAAELSKSSFVTLIVRFVWTRFEDVDPVADSVTTRRTAAARRISFTRMRL